MANKTAKKATTNTTVDNTIKVIKTTASDLNTFVLETSEELVDKTIDRTMQWQEVGHKALKGGLKIAEKQQDIVFSTLEIFKSQMLDSSKKLKDIFSNN